MANPVLNDKSFQTAATSVAGGAIMTKGRVSAVCALLFALATPGALWAWAQPAETVAPWMLPAMLASLVLILVYRFTPVSAKIIGPVYAVCMGVLVGAISRSYEARYEGIVTQAVLVTIITAMAVWALYVTGVLRVTSRFRQVVYAATLGAFVFYLGSFAISLFTGVSWVDAPTPLAIGISLVLCVIAAANLCVSFDFIDRNEGGPAALAWTAGFGVFVTLLWMYLEILRLLGAARR